MNNQVRICLSLNDPSALKVYAYSNDAEKESSSLKLLKYWFDYRNGSVWESYLTHYQPRKKRTIKADFSRLEPVRTNYYERDIEVRIMEDQHNPLDGDYLPDINNNNDNDANEKYERALQIENDIRRIIKDDDGKSAVHVVNEIINTKPIC